MPLRIFISLILTASLLGCAGDPIKKQAVESGNPGEYYRQLYLKQPRMTFQAAEYLDKAIEYGSALAIVDKAAVPPYGSRSNRFPPINISLLDTSDQYARCAAATLFIVFSRMPQNSNIKLTPILRVLVDDQCPDKFLYYYSSKQRRSNELFSQLGYILESREYHPELVDSESMELLMQLARKYGPPLAQGEYRGPNNAYNQWTRWYGFTRFAVALAEDRDPTEQAELYELAINVAKRGRYPESEQKELYRTLSISRDFWSTLSESDSEKYVWLTRIYSAKPPKVNDWSTTWELCHILSKNVPIAELNAYQQATEALRWCKICGNEEIKSGRVASTGSYMMTAKAKQLASKEYDLPAQVVKDQQMLKASQYLKVNDYDSAYPYLYSLIMREERGEFTLQDSIYYYAGESAYKLSKKVPAENDYYRRWVFSSASHDFTKKYLTRAGVEGRFYQEALILLDDIETQNE